MAEAKSLVLLVHGMGNYPPGSFKAEFIQAANASLQQFQAHKNDKIEDLVELVEINYDGFFNEMRAKMADQASSISERLQGIGALTGLSWGPDLVLKLTSIESKFGDDAFLYTHLLDVFFYASLLGAKVRVDVAKQLSGIIAKYPDRKIHIVAHSLGTAVVHDTLALLYRGDFQANDSIADLNTVTHRLKSLWMIANVSRLISSVNNITDTYTSTVNPSAQGCLDFFYNVRHELDPFTWPAKFDPKDDGSWIPSDDFDLGYQLLETTVITQLDTHDFSAYIRNPKVSIRLFGRLINFKSDLSEVTAVLEAYQKMDIAGAYQELKESLEEINLRDKGSIKAYIAIGKEFKKLTKQLQNGVDAI